ncbi:hypothetical protein ACJRO7_022007 [Eucalyptus globulus]|uniref:F-box domain-containing protein n=1 Tax=Eucalyptus globulus TaxID=34317 RepID=A0ABD3KN99_EUCGL
MEGLSDDLITKILERVPKKPLLGFRCMSKRWRRLIDERFFRKSLLYLFPMFSSSLYCIDLRRPGDFEEIENPLGWERIVLLGSCRGFLCIYNEDNGQVAIWNPSTRWCKRLPPADAEIAHRLGSPACVYGFGYDYWNDEFVLLMLVQTLEDPIVSAVSIYRQRANAWRRLQGTLPYSLVDPRTMGVFLRGHLHWIMRRDPMQNSAKVLVAFDIHTEKSVEAHQLSFKDNRLPMYLAILGGRLCFITYREREGGVRAWIISGYGSEESRESLFRIRDYLMDGVLLQPLASSQNGGQVLLLYHRTLVWYDLLTHDEKPFHINGMPGFFEAATCFFTESHLKRFVILCLFSVDSPRLYFIGSLTDVMEKEYPQGWQRIRLLGSCNRILCFSNVDDGHVALWRPTIGDFWVLPPADAEIPHGLGLSPEITHILDPSVQVYGLGHDDRSRESVVLRLVQSVEEPVVSEVSIYRARVDAWRRLQGIPYYLVGPHEMGVSLCNHLHWIMRREGSQDSPKVLVAFDFHTEEFVEVHLPDSIDNTLGMGLADLEGCLCLIIYGEQMGVDVWIMREYGLNGPWDPFFSIPDHPKSRRPVRPLAYSQNGHQVLVGMDHETLVWYNLHTNDVKEFLINGMPRSFDEAVCL